MPLPPGCLPSGKLVSIPGTYPIFEASYLFREIQSCPFPHSVHNKRVWSPSYVLMTCGLASTMQGLLMYVIDIRGHNKWTPTFLIFGTNPLFLYLVSELLAIIFGSIKLNFAIYGGIHSVITDVYVASLVYAIFFVAIHTAIGYPLYKRHIYIKL